MKKAISILLTLAVLMLCTANIALADDFSVRNGIHFGMTVDEVKATEQENGVLAENIHYEGNPSSELSTDFIMSSEFEALLESNQPIDVNPDGSYQITYTGISVAGVENSNIIYSFTKVPRSLEEIQYSFETNEDDSNADSIFARIAQSMTEKYGNSVHSSETDNIIFPLCSTALKSSLDTVSFGWSSPIKYNEWLLDYDSYYVIIDETRYSEKIGSKLYQRCELSYKYISGEEIEALEKSITDETNKVEEETNRDL